ncbi:recombinase family protein [Streptomyces sp. PTM05]|uniref:Recombinase family protein n=1 Tax=Streptantibioticus parmotrematis TaxID=2873249 RepID=A0ABS7R1G4_9ACTN|nr:recombinase family protein [Streptantibioticus parmotrematis]MBY8889303.1 recombinase family protein [Streptantibioticus parmotrematis]
MTVQRRARMRFSRRDGLPRGFGSFAVLEAEDAAFGLLPVAEPDSYYRARRLQQLRIEGRHAALTPLDGPVKVVLYAMSCQESTLAEDLDRLETVARDRGWQVVRRYTDTSADAEPVLRPGWQQARGDAGSGLAHGILAVDRRAVSRADEPYERELRWLGERLTFLELLAPETAMEATR